MELAIDLNLDDLKNGGLKDLIARKKAADKKLEAFNTMRFSKRKHR